MAPDPVGRLLAAYPVLLHACRQRRVPVPDGRARVSAHQATVLSQLERAEGITLTELAARMDAALPTMSLLVDRLVRAGLMHRDRDPADGRRVLLRLSAMGERVRGASSLLDPDRVRALLELLSPEERTLGVEGLATLARAARRLPRSAADDTEDTTRGRR